jgi:hypothetical protein
MTLAVSGLTAMEIVMVSFLVFLVSAAALTVGQWFGRGPINGGCRPGDASGSCTHAGLCGLRCPARRQRAANRESG